jgi:hypothetical protein
MAGKAFGGRDSKACKEIANPAMDRLFFLKNVNLN